MLAWGTTQAAEDEVDDSPGDARREKVKLMYSPGDCRGVNVKLTCSPGDRPGSECEDDTTGRSG